MGPSVGFVLPKHLGFPCNDANECDVVSRRPLVKIRAIWVQTWTSQRSLFFRTCGGEEIMPPWSVCAPRYLCSVSPTAGGHAKCMHCCSGVRTRVCFSVGTVLSSIANPNASTVTHVVRIATPVPRVPPFTGACVCLLSTCFAACSDPTGCCKTWRGDLQHLFDLRGGERPLMFCMPWLLGH